MSRTLRRLIPSPAMIVALVALVMSLGSSAYALVMITGDQIQDGSVTGDDIQERSLRGHDLKKNSVGRLAINESRLRSVRAKGVRFWAVVNESGVIVGGKGVVIGDQTKTGAGRYLVIFDRDVSRCSYQATVGNAGTTLETRGSEITLSAHSNPKAVRVRTADATNVEDPRAFQLALIC